jgi:hypothetical protein
VTRRKSKYPAYLAFAIAVFIASPLDDIIFTSLLGTALFGLGTVEFYSFLALTTILSVMIWKRHSLKHLYKRILDFKDTNEAIKRDVNP